MNSLNFWQLFYLAYLSLFFADGCGQGDHQDRPGARLPVPSQGLRGWGQSGTFLKNSSFSYFNCCGSGMISFGRIRIQLLSLEFRIRILPILFNNFCKLIKNTRTLNSILIKKKKMSVTYRYYLSAIVYFITQSYRRQYTESTNHRPNINNSG